MLSLLHRLRRLQVHLLARELEGPVGEDVLAGDDTTIGKEFVFVT